MKAFCIKLFLLFIAFHHIAGECNDSVIFFGDLDIEKVPIDYLQIVSTIGVYRRVENSVGVRAYQHDGRPDIFLLRQPTRRTGVSTPIRWVIATLPDNKKPAAVTEVHQVWPDAASILLEGRFPDADGTTVPWSLTGWNVPSWSTPRQCSSSVGGLADNATLLSSLSVRCVHDVRTDTALTSSAIFGQCSSGLWRVISQLPADHSLTSGVLRSESSGGGGQVSHGRPVYSSGLARVAVDSNGLWRLQQTLAGANSPVYVSRSPAERLEFVSGWRREGVVPSGDSPTANDDDIRVVCEGVPSGVADGDVCAGAPCRNNGTCYSGGGGGAATGGSGLRHYHCHCRFDTVSVNCASVRECTSPPVPVNSHLLYTSDLSLHGKAFYTCAVGYRLETWLSSSNSNLTFAICDGSKWLGIPRCVPVRARADISDAVIHSCKFGGTPGTVAPSSGGSGGGWCPGYRHSPVRQLESGGAVSPLRWQLKNAGEERGLVATVVAESSGSGDGTSSRQLVARLSAPCVFVPASGCLVFDFATKGASLSVTSSSGGVLWTSGPGSGSGWTTATVPLSAGTWSLQYEVSTSTASSSRSSVQLDQLRVFGWNCTRTGRVLFGSGSPDSAPRAGALSQLVIGSVSLVLLFWLAN